MKIKEEEEKKKGGGGEGLKSEFYVLVDVYIMMRAEYQ